MARKCGDSGDHRHERVRVLWPFPALGCMQEIHDQALMRCVGKLALPRAQWWVLRVAVSCECERVSWQRFLPAPSHRCERASPTRDAFQRLTTGVREPASRDPPLVPRHGEPAPVGSLPSCWRAAAVERGDAVAPPL